MASRGVVWHVFVPDDFGTGECALLLEENNACQKTNRQELVAWLSHTLNSLGWERGWAVSFAEEERPPLGISIIEQLQRNPHGVISSQAAFTLKTAQC
jgi:hypothetical protein